MSTIYFTICILFLFGTTSARVRAPAPRVVYSAVILNKQDSPVQCNVVWSSPHGETLTSNLFSVDVKNYHTVKEETVDMGGWIAARILKTIHCGDLVLNAPFDKVHSPVKNWEFHVETDKIVSVGPSSQATKTN